MWDHSSPSWHNLKYVLATTDGPLKIREISYAVCWIRLLTTFVGFQRNGESELRTAGGSTTTEIWS